jgi:hypothetical protein
MWLEDQVWLERGAQANSAAHSSAERKIKRIGMALIYAELPFKQD